jgi:hypothetical protein
MFVPLLICLLIVGVASNIISMTMKCRLIDDGVEAKRWSWWSRDFRMVNRTYREYYPNSIMPSIDRYVGYLVYALFAAVVLAGTLFKG